MRQHDDLFGKSRCDHGHVYYWLSCLRRYFNASGLKVNHLCPPRRGCHESVVGFVSRDNSERKFAIKAATMLRTRAMISWTVFRVFFHNAAYSKPGNSFLPSIDTYISIVLLALAFKQATKYLATQIQTFLTTPASIFCISG